MDDAMKRWLHKAFKASRKPIDDSDVFFGLYTSGYIKDPMCLLQLGYALACDKPIFLVAEEGVLVPDKLRRAADGIEWFKTGDTEDFKAASTRLATRIAEARANA